MTRTRHRTLFFGVLGIGFLWFIFSRLVFSPVPWPDGSAFYLPALDLFSWPPRWRMHAQAAFVPSYDQANFNLMPGLPIYLGISCKWILNHVFQPALSIKIASLIPLAAYAAVAWKWTLERTLRPWVALLLGAAAFFDPVLRWGTLVVRTEVWIGLAGALLIREISREKISVWRTSAILAGAAYFHFEAAYLLPLVIAGTLPWQKLGKPGRPRIVREWLVSLAQIGLRTSLFLIPWLIYVLLNFHLFKEQMQIQFFRLAHWNQLFLEPYQLFHSLFLSHGSAHDLPKFFNVGKGFFWLLFLLLTVLVFVKRPKDRAILAGATAFWTGIYLWFSKPEVWFAAVCHFMLWPWVSAWIAAAKGKRDAPIRRSILVLTGWYLAFSLFATFSQQIHTPKYYSWKNYNDWIGCIERTIQAHLPNEAKPKIWQPHTPDVLVEIATHHRSWDLTRALDFPARREIAWAFTKRADVILLTRSFDLPQGQTHAHYEGAERPVDLELTQSELELPFGPEVIHRLPKEQPGKFERRVCQAGPFWADLAMRAR